MDSLNNIAHVMVTLLSTFARFILTGIEWIEDAMRSLVRGVGLGADVQTLIVVFVYATFLLGVLRLFKGRIRTTAALMLFLFLAHSLERIAHVVAAS